MANKNLKNLNVLVELASSSSRPITRFGDRYWAWGTLAPCPSKSATKRTFPDPNKQPGERSQDQGVSIVFQGTKIVALAAGFQNRGIRI